MLEGFRADIYKCQANQWTIGYGHKMFEPKISSISKSEADKLLMLDVRTIEGHFAKSIKVQLSTNQFDALVSLTFNIGIGAFQRSVLRQKINYLAFDEVEHEIMRWVYIRGKISQGLIRRRKLEADLFFAHV